MKNRLLFLFAPMFAMFMLGCDSAGDFFSPDGDACCHRNSDCDIGQECQPDPSGGNCGQCVAAPDGDTDGDVALDGDDAPDGDTPTDGDAMIDGDAETDGDAMIDGDAEPDGDAGIDGDEEYVKAIDGYLIVALHNGNSMDYTGNEISFYELSETGELSDMNLRLTVYDNPSDAAFTPDGSRLLVTHPSGEVLIYDMQNNQPQQSYDLSFEGYFSELLIPQDYMAYLLDGNPVAYGGGFLSLDLGSDPPELTDDFVALHAAAGMAITPDNAFAVVFASLDMEADNNTAVISVDWDGFSLDNTYDLWDDRAVVREPGFSPDGRLLAAGNESPYYDDGNVLKLFSFSEDGELAELDQTALSTPSGHVFTPNGQYLLVSSFEDNAVKVFDVTENSLSEVHSETGLGLADDLVMLDRGPLAGYAIVALYNEIVLLEIGSDGGLTIVDRVMANGEEMTRLVGGIAVGSAYTE